MVIHTEYRGTRYSMGSSDPLPAGFEIRFGGLNFQATGNGYLMCLTNHEELRARRQAGSAPVAAARVATTATPASMDAAGPSASRRRRRSGQRSRQARSEQRQAERVASQRGAPVSTTTAAPAGERAASGSRFPIGLRGATTAYTANANASAAMRRVPPGRHVYVARDPGASAGDESSLGSLDALPPANLHGYAEWDFFGVPDPVMFRRFLDATDYRFGCFDDSSTGSYDPARECCVIISNDPANATGTAGTGDGEVTPALGTASRLAAGPSAPAPSPPTGADINAQLAQARELEARLAEEYRTVRLLRASMAGEASVRGERVRELGIQARDRINADFNVDNPDTPPRASQKLIAAATLLRAMPAPSTPEARNLHREAQALIEQAVVRQAESSVSRNRQQGGRMGRWGRAGARTLSARGWSDGAPRQPWTHAGQRTAPRYARASTGRQRPQRHQRSADEQSRCASGSRLPPPTGWTLRQR
jgi:hypothetical protein